MITVSNDLDMPKLNEFSHNHHPHKVKIVAKYILRRNSELVLRKVREISQYRLSNKKFNLKEKK
jgi:hypothetical protein